MTKLSFVETHTPLFIGGINLTTKIDPTRKTGIVLEFDDARRVLYVTMNGVKATVFESNIAYMIEQQNAAPKLKKV